MAVPRTRERIVLTFTNGAVVGLFQKQIIKIFIYSRTVRPPMQDTAGAAVDRGAGRDRPVVAVDGLTYAYPGTDEPALRDVSFSIGDGEILGFLGPSGAGKSTTQKVLTGLLDDYEGSVRVFGDEVRATRGEYYERIGVSAESPTIYRKLTDRENLGLFASLYAREVMDPEAALALVGLADDADRRVAEYSKGMAMRLNLALALAHEPELLFLDEPTNGLDPANARVVKDLIRERRDEGATVFLTTHDMGVADELCDRVAFIVDGELPVVDAPKALKLAHGEPTVRVEYRSDGELLAEEFPLAELSADGRFTELLDGGVETIHTEEATLEDVFIEVTGRSLQ